MSKRILILSEAYGAGHTKAAEAIKDGVQVLGQEIQVDVIELGNWLRPYFSKALSNIYVKILQYSPKLWGMMYHKSVNKKVIPSFEYFFHRVLYTQIMQLLNEYQPSIIICTHPLPSAVISRLKRIGLKTPLYTVVTDYAVHGSWISDHVDKYFIPSTKLVEGYEKLGIEKNKLFPYGIPVHPSFWRKQKKELIRQKLNLPNKPTMLCMGGGLGIGLSNEYIETLLTYQDDLQLIFVTGKNKKLYKIMKDLQENAGSNFKLYSFVDNISELMDASDIVFTKPGGITCSEAISKKIPLLLGNAIPGQEEENLSFMIKEKYGVFIQDSTALHHFIQYFINDPGFLKKHYNPVPIKNGGYKLIHEIIKEN